MKKITVADKEDALTRKIIACCYQVHRELGPGFTERIYHNALKLSLQQSGLKYETEKSLTVSYQGENIGKFRLDLIVEDEVVLELKDLTGNIPKVFEFQVLSYLKVSGYKIGLLINFGNKSCQIRRLMN